MGGDWVARPGHLALPRWRSVLRGDVMKKLFLLSAVFLLMGLSVPTGSLWAQAEDQMCLMCHGDPAMLQGTDRAAQLLVTPDALGSSVHGAGRGRLHAMPPEPPPSPHCGGCAVGGLRPLPHFPGSTTRPVPAWPGRDPRGFTRTFLCGLPRGPRRPFEPEPDLPNLNDEHSPPLRRVSPGGEPGIQNS